MRHILLSFSALLLQGCSQDRLRPETARCAVEAHQGSKSNYLVNAANTEAGLLAFVNSGQDETTLEVWRSCKESGRFVLPLKQKRPTHLAMSRSGRFLIASDMHDGVDLLDLEARQRVAWFPDCYGPAAFSADERFAVFGCRREGVRILRLNDQKFVADVGMELSNPIHALAVDDQFKRLAFGEGHGPLHWMDLRETTDGFEFANIRSVEGSNGEWISGLAFDSSSNKLYSVRRYGLVDTWEVTSGKRSSQWETELKWVGSVTFFRNSERVVIFGTTEPGGFAGPKAVVVDTESGQQQAFTTDQNYLFGAHIPRSDELFITGLWKAPRIRADISEIP